jgi:flagellar hook-associated protein 1 FlgK
MSNLLASLQSAGNALRAFDQVLEVTQNNVANASTPGYAKQRQSLLAMSFDPVLGYGGGVKAGEIQSARNQYAEQAVRRQAVLLGQSQQDVDSLTALQSQFDISGGAGIPAALNNLFQSFSAWAQSPADTVARQTVIERATDVAHTFQQSAADLSNVAQDTEQQLQQTVDHVNQLVGQLSVYNQRVMAGSHNDGGLDAQVNATLEDLSQYVDITALQQADGTVTVLLNGETPLLVQDRQYAIGYQLTQPQDPAPTYTNARPYAKIVGADGADLTAKITTGQLGSLLNTHNRLLPSYIGDAYQAGDLNTMAKQLAQRVNQLLASGNLTTDANAQQGAALFTYDTSNDTNVAATLSVDPSVTTDQLAPIDPGPPVVANGIPLALAQLANPRDGADEIDGASYSSFYGNMAARVGSALNDAANQQQVQQSAVAQAKDIRQQMSGVSLDEEATTLIQFQRAYEANSKVVTILDQISQALISMLQT